MANQLLSPKIYANVGLKLLKNNLVFAKLTNSEFKDEFKKIGATVYVKRPPEFVIRNGPTASPQDVVEGEVPVSINLQKGVDTKFSSTELTLTVDSLMADRELNGAMAQIAQQIDSDLASQVLQFPNWVGTPGTPISTAAAFFRAPQRLDEMSIPAVDRNAALAPADVYALAGSFVNLYAQTTQAVDALTKAKIPILGNVTPYATQSVVSITMGTRTNGTVSGAGQNVVYSASVLSGNNYTQSLVVAGLGIAATVAAGEVFTLAGVFAVNPRTKAVLPYLMQFTVITAATADGSGNATLTIANPIIASGAFQNASAAPANAAVLTWLGAAGQTYNANAAFHKQAITLVSAKLIMPYTGECDYSTDPDTGITLRYWRYSDGTNDVHNHRWDVLYGVANVDRRLGTRIGG